jgi:hypothetical protein
MHDVERAIARIAARQGKIISRELLDVGIGQGGIVRLVRTGAWQQLHDNVCLLDWRHSC